MKIRVIGPDDGGGYEDGKEYVIDKVIPKFYPNQESILWIYLKERSAFHAIPGIGF